MRQRKAQRAMDSLSYCHLIPVPLGQIGLSSSARHLWRSRIRSETFARYGQNCYYCGATEAQAWECAPAKRNSPFDCHEVWKFDDQHLVAKLIRIVPLCKNCHLFTSGYLTTWRDEQGRDHIKYEEDWLSTMVGVSLATATRRWKRARRLWQVRNRTDKWQVDYGAWHWVMHLQPGELYQSPLKEYQTAARRRLLQNRKRQVRVKELFRLEHSEEGSYHFDDMRMQLVLANFYGDEDILVRIDPVTLRFGPTLK
jgi:hypothetical protein